MNKVVLFFAFLVCLGSFAYANQYDDLSTESFINKCAEKVVDNKIYLKPGHVFVAKRDIVIKVDESMVLLEAVYCDMEGVYVHDHQLRYLIHCDVCKRFYDPEKQRPMCPHRFFWEQKIL